MEWHAQDLVEGLMAAGWRVSVLTTPLPKQPALAPLRVNGTILEAGSKPGSYGLRFLPSFWGSTGRAIRELTPDVIHAQGYTGPACWFSLGKEFPILTTIHGTLWSETDLRDGAPAVRGVAARARLHWRYKHLHLLGPVWRKFLASPAPLTTDSEFTRQQLLGEPGFNASRPLRVVPLGFAMSRFPLVGRDAARREWGLAPQDVLLVSVGRVETVKRPDLVLEGFLRIAADHPRARLLLAGDGALLPALRERAASAGLGDRIQFPGRVAAEKLPSLLEAADLFLNADHGAPAFGLANAEALCQGAPVLATDSGAHGEVVREGDGMLVPRDNAGAWEAALRRMVAQLPEAESAREARRARARLRFDRAAMVRGIVASYREISG